MTGPGASNRHSPGRRRCHAKAEDLAELQAIIAELQWLPASALESRYDLLHHMRRLAGRLRAIAARIEAVPPPVPIRSAREALAKEYAARERRARKILRLAGQKQLSL